MSKKKPLFSVDYHAHILPGCDHGSDGVKTSLRQLAMARDAEIETICATPHFYPHKENPEPFLARRAACFDVLRRHMPEDTPDVLLGAEVLMCEGMEKMKHIESLCLQGTRELLFEMPMYRWSDRLIASVLSLHARGDLHMIMAHADRYPARDVEIFLEAGIGLQVNADRLSNRFKNRGLIDWIRGGYVEYFGSDIHGTKAGYKAWEKCKKLQKRWQNP